MTPRDAGAGSARGTALRVLTLASLVAVPLLPSRGPTLLLGERMALRGPAPRTAAAVVWVSGEGSRGEVPLSAPTLRALAALGPRLVVCDQKPCISAGAPAIAQGTLPVPGEGGFVRDLGDFRGTLAEAALEALDLPLVPRGWPGPAPWLDMRTGPLELTPALARANPEQVRGRVLVVGPRETLRRVRTPRGQLPVPEALAWALHGRLAGELLYPLGRGLTALLALAAAALVWRPTVEDRGGEASRRAGLLAGGAVVGSAALAGLGVLVDPLPLVVACGGARWMAPPPDPDGERRLLELAIERVRSGEDPERVLADLPEARRALRRSLYAHLRGGGEPALPDGALPELTAGELWALAELYEETEQVEARLEALEWAILKAPEDTRLARAHEDCREELLGGLALLDLEGIKSQLAKRYRELELLGQGAMGLVLEGRDVLLDRPVALKVVSPGILGDADSQARFFREIEALAELTHPNVVQIYGSYPGDLPHYAMEHLRGETLRAALARGSLGEEAGAAVLRQFAEAMDYIHDRGILHRDLKPDNLLLADREGAPPPGEGQGWDAEPLRLVVIDFGIAKGPGARALTRAGDVLGTLSYMAPEQVRGDPAGRAADRFAVGVIAYEVLAGRPPFASPGAAAEGPEVPLGRARPDLPARLVSAVESLLEPDPDQRPEDLGELRDALAEWRGGP